jgi:hypothetical protein
MIQQKQMSCFLLWWKNRIPAKSQEVPATTWQTPKKKIGKTLPIPPLIP